ncbi:MAG: KUP/HAK/KT family potassium transporter [Phycisphaerales bacterium]|nr:KUP/HAK/KT family potassium transporter [Phycisphaerales bacterium]
MSTPRIRKGTPLLALGALGVVFGDIGTSPLYALRATLQFAGGEQTAEAHVMGALSLMVWAVVIIIGIKYIALLMRADNGGEGGLLALLALAAPDEDETPRRGGGVLLWIALIGAALLYGDGIITPAISVLSSMGGLVPPEAKTQPHWILVASAFIVLGIFVMQRFGSGVLGWLLGPLMLGWFILIAVLGLQQIIKAPAVLEAISPLYAVSLIAASPMTAFLMLGGVVLCVTGGEALYADMGHFGRRAITLAWWIVVCPSLLLAYFGQGAAVLISAEAAGNPFFALAPGAMRVPMVVIATLAAIIASQAIISGVFSMTRQLMQRGLLPALRVVHTSDVEGQIYLPGINLLMAIACILIVLLFGSAESLAAAYGLAVTGVMVLTTILFGVVASRRWKWSWWYLGPLLVVLLSIELALLGSNILKIPSGGWVPLLVAALVLMIVAVWKKGMYLINRGRLEDGLPLERFIESLDADEVVRCPGTGVFFGRDRGITPVTIRKLQRHVPVLPETIVIVHLHASRVPRVPHQHRLRLKSNEQGVWTAEVRFGYLQKADLPSIMRDAAERGVPADPKVTTFWVRRDQVAIATDHRGMARWRVAIFAYLLRNATVLPDLLDLPPRRTVEIGMRAPL